jgi:hypothetical protein
MTTPSTSPTRAVRRAAVSGALTGGLFGLAWGVAVRVFMRLVTTGTPSFSWVGTAFILGLAVLFGVGVGAAAAALAAGGRRWWLLAAVPGLLLFAGQGMPFLPAFALGSPAVARWRRVGWAVAAVAATVPAVLLWSDVRLDEDTMLSAPTRVEVSMLVGLPLLALALVAMGARLWRPVLRREPAGVRTEPQMWATVESQAPAQAKA